MLQSAIYSESATACVDEIESSMKVSAFTVYNICIYSCFPTELGDLSWYLSPLHQLRQAATSKTITINRIAVFISYFYK